MICFSVITDISSLKYIFLYLLYFLLYFPRRSTKCIKNRPIKDLPRLFSQLDIYPNTDKVYSKCVFLIVLFGDKYSATTIYNYCTDKWLMANSLPYFEQLLKCSSWRLFFWFVCLGRIVPKTLILRGESSRRLSTNTEQSVCHFANVLHAPAIR